MDGSLKQAVNPMSVCNPGIPRPAFGIGLRRTLERTVRAKMTRRAENKTPLSAPGLN
jgi:hypothetical protein